MEGAKTSINHYYSFMKKIFFVFASMILSFAVQSQVMQVKAQWATLSIPQLKCWECKDRLDQYLLTEKGPSGDGGIVQWKIVLTNATMRIQYVPDRITLGYIRTAIANAGFDVDSVKAEPENYKLLPPICKRKEEGGGPQKNKPCSLPPEERN